MKACETCFIAVTGGVISGVGKGVASASIGKIMKEYGYKTTLIKIDPYINYDAGTLRPTEHGEVWVTCDGGEIDQDLGTYERFMNEDIPKQNNITTGQIYKAVIDKERRGEYLGQTVQFIPHIIDEIVDRIKRAAQGFEIAIVEIGGTVGDYENMPFLFAVKSIERELDRGRVIYGLVTYLPVPVHIGEMKTKPTQQAIRMLSEQGIIPDFIVCRSQEPLDEVRKKKIEISAHIPLDMIITAPDIDLIYKMPLEFERQNVGKKILKVLGLAPRKKSDWSGWQKRISTIENSRHTVRIAIVGKYIDIGEYSLTDSYVSICHALIHAGVELDAQVTIDWIDAKRGEKDFNQFSELENYAGIIVPGGFGTNGVEGKINAITYAREHNIPFLGLCYGMQLAAIEYARKVCALSGAHSTEINPNTQHPIIDELPMQKEKLDNHQYGGTMRLGAYDARIKKGSRIEQLYQNAHNDGIISERHRHRYEVNPVYVDRLEKAGFVFSAYHERSDGTRLMEFAEIPQHRFFVATQAHPEFTSRFEASNPVFYGFIKACLSSHGIID